MHRPSQQPLPLSGGCEMIGAFWGLIPLTAKVSGLAGHPAWSALCSSCHANNLQLKVLNNRHVGLVDKRSIHDSEICVHILLTLSTQRSTSPPPCSLKEPQHPWGLLYASFTTLVLFSLCIYTFAEEIMHQNVFWRGCSPTSTYCRIPAGGGITVQKMTDGPPPL